MPEFEFPAAASMYYFGVRLVDDIHDNGSFRSKVLYALFRFRIGRAEEKLRELGLEVPPVEVSIGRQHGREAERGRGHSYYSCLIETQCSEIFSHAARLAGVPGNSSHLGEVGRHIGRLTYLVDSYVDLENDKAKGKFNVYRTSSSQETNIEAESRQMLRIQLAESVTAMRRSISRVKLQRFEESIRHVVTDGLIDRAERLVAEARVFGAKPILYSFAPIILPIVLSSLLSGSSGDDCDDCCPCGSGSSSRSLTYVDPLSALINHAVTATGEAAVGTGVGIAGAEAISRLRGGGEEEAPVEEPPVEEEPPIEEEPVEEEAPVEEQPAPEKQTPSTVLTEDQVKQTLDWGIKHNRSPDQIQKDLNEWDKARGGPGDVKPPSDMTPVTVTTKNGPATATPNEAKEYESAKKELDRVNHESEWVRKEMQKIESEIRKWSEFETGPIIARAYLGAGQPFGVYNDYQNKLSQIDEKYGAPRHPSWRDFEWDKHAKPDTPGWDKTVKEYEKWCQKTESDYQEALRQWQQTPEARGEVSDAHHQERMQAASDYVSRIQEMAGQKPGPGQERSWLTKPRVKLDKLNAKQDSFIKYLRDLQASKREALDGMRVLEERARQGVS